MRSISCPNCGGSLRISETTSLHCCEYCGSQVRDEIRIDIDSAKAIANAVENSLRRSRTVETLIHSNEDALETALQSVMEERKRFEDALYRARIGKSHKLLRIKKLTVPTLNLLTLAVVAVFLLPTILNGILPAGGVVILILLILAVLALKFHGRWKAYRASVIEPLEKRVAELRNQEEEIRQRMTS